MFRLLTYLMFALTAQTLPTCRLVPGTLPATFFSGEGSEQIWGSCLGYYAYRKMIAVENGIDVKNVFLRLFLF